MFIMFKSTHSTPEQKNCYQVKDVVKLIEEPLFGK